MCRLLVVSSKKDFEISPFVKEFAQLSKNSLTPDGDRQKDGWGLMTTKNIYKSIMPIWEDDLHLYDWGNDRLLILHTRSASNNKNNIEFNQPFIKDGLVFVFNGLLKGVKINIDGKIGSEKLFNLITKFYQENTNNYLENFYQLILNKTELIVGMNIVIVDLNLNKIHILSVYTQNENYFALNFFQDQEKTIICSEPILNFNFKKLTSGTLKTIDL